MSTDTTNPTELDTLYAEKKTLEANMKQTIEDWQKGTISDTDLETAAAQFQQDNFSNTIKAFEVALSQPLLAAQGIQGVPVLEMPVVAVTEQIVVQEPVVAAVPEIEKRVYLKDPEVGEARNIRSIKVPEQMENNVNMGHEKINVLMAGDGATPSTACLVTGVPGSGKSTMMFQLADAISREGHIALYNTCEESLLQVSKVSNRLRLKHGFYVSSFRSVFDLRQHAQKFQADNPGKQVFLFVDSLQTIEVPNVEYDENFKIKMDTDGITPLKRKGRPTGGQTQEVEVTEILTNWCKTTYGIMFLIGQVNKNGEFSGKQAIKHWVDAHLHLDINRDRYSGDYGCRTAEMTKNRFGVAGIYYPFEIEARGIKFTEPKQNK